MSRGLLLLAVIGTTSLTLLTGCGDKSSTAPKTPQEVKDFKGGPPPPEAQAKIREMMQKGGPGGPPPGAAAPK